MESMERTVSIAIYFESITIHQLLLVHYSCLGKKGGSVVCLPKQWCFPPKKLHLQQCDRRVETLLLLLKLEQ